jgi:hypothetical protein
VAGIQQFLRADRTDVARAAGDKNVHGASVEYFRHP